MLRKWAVRVLVIGTVLLEGCQDWFQVEVERPRWVYAGNVRLPEEETMIEDALLLGDTLKLFLAPGSNIPQFQPGEIVLGEKGEGYLRRVVSIISQGDTLVLLTEPATLLDAFEELHIDTVVALRPPSDIFTPVVTHPIDTSIVFYDGHQRRTIRIRSAAPRVALVQDTSTFPFDWRFVVPDINIFSAGDVSLSADSAVYCVRFLLNFGIEISGSPTPALQYFLFSIERQERLDIFGFSSSLGGDTISFDTSVVLWHFSSPRIHFVIGTIVIGFNVDLDLLSRIDQIYAHDGAVNFNGGAEAFTNTVVGVEYSGELSPIWNLDWGSDVQWGFEVLPPEFSITLTPLALQVEVESHIFDVVGPEIGAEVGISSDVTLLPPEITATLYTFAFVGGEFEIFGFDIYEFHHTFDPVEWEVFHWDLCAVDEGYVLCGGQ